MEITIDDFDKVEFRAGTVVAVDINKRARKPAYKVTIDLGEYGIKTSSAQLTDMYSAQDLLGRQVVCCTNLAPMHIGDVKSEVRIMGLHTEQGCVLLQPASAVPNGATVY